MKSWIRYTLATTVPFGLSFLFFFSAVPGIKNQIHQNDISNEDRFFSEIKTVDNYSIKDANIVYYTTQLNNDKEVIDRVYDVKFDVDLNLKDMENIKAKGAITVDYSYLYGTGVNRLIDADFYYVDNSIYIDSKSGFLGTNDYTFKESSLMNLISSLMGDDQSYLDLNLIFGYFSNIKEVKENDKYIYDTKTFKMEIEEFKTAIIFKADKNYKLTSLYTAGGQDFSFNGGSSKLRLSALNIKKGEEVNVELPSNYQDYKPIDDLLNSLGGLLTNSTLL